MISSQSSINPLLLPTGEIRVPVCVGDIPSHRYQIPIHTITKVVASYLEKHPGVPGVILVDGNRFHSVVSRLRFFQRLGHMYGVDLFLRKPILELQKNLQAQAYTISSDMRIQDAVGIALERPFQDLYDPFVVLHENGEMRLLEMHALLTAQSHALQNVHNLMSSLTQLERIIKAYPPLEEFLGLSLDSLRRVVPFHRVMIHVQDSYFYQLPGKHPALHLLDQKLARDVVVRTVLNTRQSLHIEDVRMVPAWEDFTLLNGVRSWMGVPLLNSTEIFGLLSLMRHSNSPFNKDEMNMCKAFAELIAIALHKTTEMESQPKNEGSSNPDPRLPSQLEYAAMAQLAL